MLGPIPPLLPGIPPYIGAKWRFGGDNPPFDT